MNAKLREKYQSQVDAAARIENANTRRARLGQVFMDMRRDKDVSTLMLCAFIQDNARHLKETK